MPPTTWRSTSLGAVLCLGAGQLAAQGFVGDVGVMAVHTTAVVAGAPASQTALPYVYGQWGRAFARLDTWGVRLLPVGQGHLEASLRVSTEGYEGRGTGHPALGDRRSPTPVGLSSLQITDLGAWLGHVMHDPVSGGQFAEFSWAGRWSWGAVTFYPQLGAQYRSSRYGQHLYGITDVQAQATGLTPYQATASWVPQATLHMSLPLSGPWSLQAQWRQRWLDGAYTRSPLVNASTQSSALLALTYRWE